MKLLEELACDVNVRRLSAGWYWLDIWCIGLGGGNSSVGVCKMGEEIVRLSKNGGVCDEFPTTLDADDAKRWVEYSTLLGAMNAWKRAFGERADSSELMVGNNGGRGTYFPSMRFVKGEPF